MAVETGAGAPRRAAVARQRGVVAVEFALLLAMFIGVVYVLAETAHAMYLAVTVQDLTRRAARAAAAADFTDAAAMLALRQGVLLANANGNLRLGGAIDASYVRIDYLSLSATGATAPVAPPLCPALNRVACHAAPNGPACIRLVRARLCVPDGTAECTAVPYPPLIPLPPLLLSYNSQALTLGRAASVVPAETLGNDPGRSCP